MKITIGPWGFMVPPRHVGIPMGFDGVSVVIFALSQLSPPHSQNAAHPVVGLW